jgi:hypothetical protein
LVVPYYNLALREIALHVRGDTAHVCGMPLRVRVNALLIRENALLPTMLALQGRGFA